MFPPLRMRGHTKVKEMNYDNRYEPYYRRAGLLGFALQFKRTPPTLVHTALTALVDRWRPETHSFHLPCGEMTVTLEDFAMITALPIKGHALIGRVDRKNWPDRVTALIGDSLAWLLDHRAECPQDADPRTVDQYARAYLWFLLTEVVFPDCSGDNALWMYLDFLADWDAGYSWGSAGLAYLYRSLDDATQRTEKTSGMCGCVWALSIWSWERLSVGRPEKLPQTEWTEYGEDGDSSRYPTVAYSWDTVKLFSGKGSAMYKAFTNELDNLTSFQVNWWPYYDRAWGFELNEMCERGRLLFRCIVPLICVYAVEWHLPQRVATQFGVLQHTPPARPHDTGGYDLHKKSRQYSQSILDWADEHKSFVTMWDERTFRKDGETSGICWNVYERHMNWYDDGIKFRLRLRPRWTEADMASLQEEEDSEDEVYKRNLRDMQGDFREYAPLMNRVVSFVEMHSS
ncbi:hypothetical protein VPH35_139021 [Triticum aestivum]